MEKVRFILMIYIYICTYVWDSERPKQSQHWSYHRAPEDFTVIVDNRVKQLHLQGILFCKTTKNYPTETKKKKKKKKHMRLCCLNITVSFQSVMTLLVDQ